MPIIFLGERSFLKVYEMGTKSNMSGICFFLCFNLFSTFAIITQTTVSSSSSSCPRDLPSIDLFSGIFACGNESLDLLDLPVNPCCELIEGLSDSQAFACLCDAHKRNFFGLRFDPNFSLTLRECGRSVVLSHACLFS